MNRMIRQAGLILLLVATALVGLSAQQPAFDFSSLGDELDAAILAGGCFWCMEPPYDELDGIVATISGYTGGELPNPTYQQVVRNDTGHYEAVLIVYRPEVITYEEIMDVFWVNIDPLDDGGQFCDRGSSYLSGIFYRDADQRAVAEQSRREIRSEIRQRGEIVTEIMPAETFYVAEEYHQDYYRKNPLRYRTYRTGCGRDARLQALWGRQAGG